MLGFILLFPNFGQILAELAYLRVVRKWVDLIFIDMPFAILMERISLCLSLLLLHTLADILFTV